MFALLETLGLHLEKTTHHRPHSRKHIGCDVRASWACGHRAL